MPVSKLTISHGACISSFCLLSSPIFSFFLFWSKAQAINTIWRLCTEEPHQCNHVSETFPSQWKRLKLWSGYCRMTFVWSFTWPHIRRSFNNHLIITVHPWNYQHRLRVWSTQFHASCGTTQYCVALSVQNAQINYAKPCIYCISMFLLLHIRKYFVSSVTLVLWISPKTV